MGKVVAEWEAIRRDSASMAWNLFSSFGIYNFLIIKHLHPNPKRLENENNCLFVLMIDDVPLTTTLVLAIEIKLKPGRMQSC